MKIKALIALAAVAILFSACEKKSSVQDTSTEINSSVSEGLSSDTDIGLRKIDLQDEDDVKLADINYKGAAAGESVLIERAFENAPPLISHTTEDMLPITKDYNSCLTCHDKAIAKDVLATAAPATHYFDYQANKPTGDIIDNSRFNCTQCHVAQSDAKPLVANSFKADFKDKALEKKSNLIDVMNEGVK